MATIKFLCCYFLVKQLVATVLFVVGFLIIKLSPIIGTIRRYFEELFF